MTEVTAIDVDIAIFGAAHTGLAVALALAGALGPGLRVALIERREIFSPATTDASDPRAFALAQGSVALLTAIGVWPELATHAQPVTAIDITDSSLDHAVRPTLLTYDNRTTDGLPATWIVEADRLLVALRKRLAAVAGHDLRTEGEPVPPEARRKDGGLSPLPKSGIQVLAPAVVASVEQSPTSRARVQLIDGRQITASLLIAADGARSAVREAAGIKTVGWSYPQTGLITTVAHERPHGGRAVQHFLPAGPFAILPLPGNRSCITWTEGAEAAGRILAGDDPDFLAEIERRFGHRLGELRLVGPRRSWPLEMQIARSLFAGRVVLIGDAARSVHPLAGQGLNLGLRDVAALTEVVADAMRLGLDPADPFALERYERWRRFDGQASAAGYDALNRLFSNDSMVLRAARDVGLGIVDRLPGLKQLLVAEAAGMTGEVPSLLRGRLP